MAQWHLEELRTALERKGWRYECELPGDDYSVSATWKFVRSTAEPPLLIDFEGLDDLKVLPVAESYGCRARGRGLSEGLYFRRRGHAGSRSREDWLHDLAEFIRSLDETPIPTA